MNVVPEPSDRWTTVMSWSGNDGLMAVDVRIIPIKEFLRSDVSGNLDLERSLIILLNLVEECKNHNVDRILIDLEKRLQLPCWMCGLWQGS